MALFDQHPRIPFARQLRVVGGAALLIYVVTACGNDGRPVGGSGGDGAVYLVSSSLNTPAGNTGFVSLFGSLRPSQDELSLENAYEFPGLADAWVIGERVYVSGGDSPTITRYDVSSDAGLVEGVTLSFANFGVDNTAFWHNHIVDENKAYVALADRQLVIWNPSTMRIEGTVELPEFEDRDGLMPTLAFGDRGAALSEGRLFLPVYWTGPSFAARDPRSEILVYDVENDTLVDSLDAPCPGLDFASVDDAAGRIYFSPWTGGAGAALVLGDAPTCVVEVDPSVPEITAVLSFQGLAEGREGAAFRALGDGKFVFSAFHDEEVDLEGAIEEQDPFTILGQEAWRLWGYDAESEEASPITAVASNSGATYWSRIDGVTYALIPTTDFASSVVYELAADASEATPLFEYQGFTLRLFRVR